jgi:hypothetical protein
MSPLLPLPASLLSPIPPLLVLSPRLLLLVPECELLVVLSAILGLVEAVEEMVVMELVEEMVMVMLEDQVVEGREVPVLDTVVIGMDRDSGSLSSRPSPQRTRGLITVSMVGISSGKIAI